MTGPIILPISTIGDVAAAGSVMKAYIEPLVLMLAGLAGVGVTFFLISGGIAYMTSSGQPEKLAHAKKTIRNAIVGLVIILGATLLTTILSQAYRAPKTSPTNQLPGLTAVSPSGASPGLVDVLISAIVGLFRVIIQSAGEPFIKALDYFTHATPLMATNASVFTLWLVIVGIADALFILVVALLGFHIMSSTTLGLDEIELKHLLPQLAAVFLAMNISIFAIDSVIGLSNAMITALNSAFSSASVWDVLALITKESATLGIVSLLIMIGFLVLAVLLLVYYVTRLVTLYIGAVLAPIVILLWLLPSYKDFVGTAIKNYLSMVFVLFIHVVILLLAASIFAGMVVGNSAHTLDPMMAIIVGIATLTSLLKAQSLLTHFSYATMGPKALRRMASQFVNATSYTASRYRESRGVGVASE